ncbi:MAG: response regulator, partial [Xenococcus sp. (in: cyanobacteria)]
NLLLQISDLSEQDLAQWLKDSERELTSVQKGLNKIINQKSETFISEQISGNSEIIKNQSETVIKISTDQSMLDLFCLEVESQITIFNNGLLALETNPQSSQQLEALMRASHSIKGAARMVSIEPVVQLAHVMEDYFVAAQEHTVTLTSDHVDVLLKAIDLLQNLSQIESVKLAQWLTNHQTDFFTLKKVIIDLLNHKSSQKSPTQIPLQEPPPSLSLTQDQVIFPNEIKNITTELKSEPLTTPIDSPTSQESLSPQDRVVRVSAENLNRIMGLAGESLIEANWLQPFADDLMSIKGKLTELSRYLEQLQESLDRDMSNLEGKDYLNLARQSEIECHQLFSERLDDLELYVRRTSNLSDRLYREVITSHMGPFMDGVGGFPRMIRDLARNMNKKVKLEILGKATSVDRDILKKLEAPLTHILRNAVDHGVELPEERIAIGKPPEATIRLEAIHRAGMLAITISDDGRGIDHEELRQKILKKNLATLEMVAQLSDVELLEFLFLPGFSTAQTVNEISGRGVGLDIAKSMVQEVGGTIRIISREGKGTTFHFQLPLTLSVIRTLLVEISGKPYAIPLARIEKIVTREKAEIFDVENRQYFQINKQNIGVIAAHQVLELPPSNLENDLVSIVVISDQSNSYGLVVDQFLGERDLVVRPLDPRLGKVPDISATALLSDGAPILILDVSDLVRSMDALLHVGRLAKVGISSEGEKVTNRKKILVVDDSITVREMERKLLENNGYLVDTAVNGAEGWNVIRTKTYDLVITDIDMPKMNGIELVRQMKNHQRLYNIPVIIISYRDREEDRRQGLEAGADYYLTKSSFHDETLIEAVNDIIGQ